MMPRLPIPAPLISLGSDSTKSMLGFALSTESLHEIARTKLYLEGKHFDQVDDPVDRGQERRDCFQDILNGTNILDLAS
jgi:hypothetical protein